MTTTPASRLLDLARANNPDGPTGVARAGACVVTYQRVGACRRMYDVGTDAMSIRLSYRVKVLPYIEAILAGCVTRETCDAWIADASARVAAAVASGARLPDGTVTA